MRLDNAEMENTKKEALLNILKTGSDSYQYLKERQTEILELIPDLVPCAGFDQNNPYHIYDVLDHIFHALSEYKGEDMLVKLALLLHDIGKPSCYSQDENGGHYHMHGVASAFLTREILGNLRFDKEEIHLVRELVLFHDASIHPTPKAVRKWRKMIGNEQLLRLWQVRNADILAHSELEKDHNLSRQINLLAVIRELPIDDTLNKKSTNLAISGDDLIMLGMKPGPEFKVILQQLADGVHTGLWQNTREELLLVVKSKNLLLGDITAP